MTLGAPFNQPIRLRVTPPATHQFGRINRVFSCPAHGAIVIRRITVFRRFRRRSSGLSHHICLVHLRVSPYQLQGRKHPHQKAFSIQLPARHVIVLEDGATNSRNAIRLLTSYHVAFPPRTSIKSQCIDRSKHHAQNKQTPPKLDISKPASLAQHPKNNMSIRQYIPGDITTIPVIKKQHYRNPIPKHNRHISSTDTKSFYLPSL